MATEKTKVEFDVEDAIKQLEKLDFQVKKSGKTAKKSFGTDASDGLKKFGQFASNAAPKLSKLTGGISKLASSGGLIAAGFAVAGGAILATIANVVNLASALADIDARIEVINSVAERTLDLKDLASSIEDAAENRRVFESQRNFRLQRAQSSFDQNALERARDNAQEIVNIRKSEFREIDLAFRASIRTRASAEDRLRNKLAESEVVGGKFAERPAGRQVVDLAAKAAQQAQAGNLDQAEALIEKAKKLSDELGNHSFFTNKIASAQKQVVSALEKDVKVAKTKEGQLVNERKLLKGRVTDAEEFLAILNEELKVILRQNRALGATRKILRESNRLRKDVQLSETGQRRVTAGFQQIGDISKAVGGQSDIGKFRDTIDRLLKGFKNITTLSTINEGQRSIDAIGRKVATTLKEIFKDDKVTPREIQFLVNQTVGVSDALGLLEQGIRDNSLSKALNKDVERLKSLFQGITNAGKGAVQAVAGGIGFDEDISGGALGLREELTALARRREAQQVLDLNIETGLNSETIARIAEEVEKVRNKEVGRRPSLVPTPATQLNQASASAEAAASTPGPRQVTQNVNVNTTIKGGMITTDTIKEINEIVRQEVRKLTAEAIA